MKIIIIAMRHWQIGRRYRSLALNAKRLGHQVWGFSGIQHKDDPLTIAAFNELGVQAYHGSKLKDMIDELNPDLVCGERYHPRWPVENVGQDWVHRRQKLGFQLNHTVIVPYGPGPNPGPRSHLLVTNQAQFDIKTPPRDERWTKEEVHILGAPGFDWVTEDFDVPRIRGQLGVRTDQPLIGLFLGPELKNRVALTQLLNEAKNRNWRVVNHPHPIARRLQNAETNQGFMRQAAGKENLELMQRMGVPLLVDYAPGVVGGVRFERCSGFELIAAADCLLTDTPDVIWEAYAMGKSAHYFNNFGYDRVLHASSLRTMQADGLIDLEYENTNSGVDKISYCLEAGSNDLEQDSEVIAKRLYKIDGLWWQRALQLAEVLLEE